MIQAFVYLTLVVFYQTPFHVQLDQLFNWLANVKRTLRVIH